MQKHQVKHVKAAPRYVASQKPERKPHERTPAETQAWLKAEIARLDKAIEASDGDPAQQARLRAEKDARVKELT